VEGLLGIFAILNALILIKLKQPEPVEEEPPEIPQPEPLEQLPPPEVTSENLEQTKYNE
jgi:hypothetical protein